MYGVVLATIITAGAGSAPGWTCWGCHGCHGCWGCYGCSGCHGYAFTYGCCGGCSGCWGGCYGCSGCCGGCYGGYYYSYGNCYGCYGGCTGCWGCYGGCSGCYGGTVYYYPATGFGGGEKKMGGSPGAEALEKENRMLREQLELMKKQLELLKKKAGLDETSSTSPAPASLTVTLPADAKLYIDNTVCPLTSGKRSFDTPNLEPGRQYYYVLRAELVRNGQLMAQSQKVLVQAGGQVSVEFANFAPAVATTQR
jgi:uncharacterized protein (TIGR03000 family)